MSPRRASMALVAAMALVAGGASAEWKDLRVLPGDLDAEAMQAAMTRMGRELGVRCGYCHAAGDPAAETPLKARARDMLRMTLALNRDWFGYPGAPEVSCVTCHRGKPRPKQ